MLKRMRLGNGTMGRSRVCYTSVRSWVRIFRSHTKLGTMDVHNHIAPLASWEVEMGEFWEARPASLEQANRTRALSSKVNDGAEIWDCPLTSKHMTQEYTRALAAHTQEKGQGKRERRSWHWDISELKELFDYKWKVNHIGKEVEMCTFPFKTLFIHRYTNNSYINKYALK